MLEKENYLRFLVRYAHFISYLLQHTDIESLLDINVNLLELILINVVETIIHRIRYFLFAFPVAVDYNGAALFPVQCYANIKFLQLI